MKNTASVHWDEDESKLYFNVALDQPAQLKADMYDGNLKQVMHVLDKHCRPGNLQVVKKIGNIARGTYIMKITSGEEQNDIRFKVH